MHMWGEDFDWNALNDAANYLSKQCQRWARLGIWTKEKYGTLRVSTTCAFYTEYDVINHIFYPGYVRYMFPKWFRSYIDDPVSKCLNWIGIIWLLQTYQVIVLKYFWKRAAKKWPHISEEILNDYYFTFNEERK